MTKYNTSVSQPLTFGWRVTQSEVKRDQWSTFRIVTAFKYLETWSVRRRLEAWSTDSNYANNNFSWKAETYIWQEHCSKWAPSSSLYSCRSVRNRFHASVSAFEELLTTVKKKMLRQFRHTFLLSGVSKTRELWVEQERWVGRCEGKTMSKSGQAWILQSPID